MSSGDFLGPVALLHYGCCLLLLGLATVVALRGSRRTRTRYRLRRTFFTLSLCLLLWLLSLFLEVRLESPAAQLWLGRMNFAAVALVAYLALRFVEEVDPEGTPAGPPRQNWPLAETGLLGLITLLTPLVAAREQVVDGHAVTTFGPLFPLYLLHVLGYLGAALRCAGRGWCQARSRHVRGQMALIGGGMLATGMVALVTNALLPYVWEDFRFCAVGTLSTLFFVLAVAYATFFHRLFYLRLILRKTVVYGVLLAFVLGAYSSAVFLVTQFLTAGAERVTQFIVLLIAFSFDPLRRFLEEKTDELLFGEEDQNGRRDRRRRGSGRLAALLSPWRRR